VPQESIERRKQDGSFPAVKKPWAVKKWHFFDDAVLSDSVPEEGSDSKPPGKRANCLTRRKNVSRKTKWRLALQFIWREVGVITKV
jgi:hypothetical protein